VGTAESFQQRSASEDDVTDVDARATMGAVLRDKAADDVLLGEIAAGDGAAFAVFYGRRRDAVVAFFSRRTGDPELAFDLAAETFAAVITDASRYRGDGPPSAGCSAWHETSCATACDADGWPTRRDSAWVSSGSSSPTRTSRR